jgi:hypothetical protein
MNARAVTVGWILLSVGVLAGGIWVMHARQYMPEDPRVQAMSLLDPKIFIALVLVGGLFVPDLRAAGDRLERAAGRLALRHRLRDRAAELPARGLLLHAEPQLLATDYADSADSHGTATDSRGTGTDYTERPRIHTERDHARSGGRR